MGYRVEGQATKRAPRHEIGWREKERFAFDVLEVAADAIYVHECAPGFPERSHFVYVNPAFEQLYECEREHVVGRELEEFFSTRAAPQDMRRIFGALKAGARFRVVRAYTRKDGSATWIDVNCRPQSAQDGDHVRWICIARDVTEMVRAQQRAELLAAALQHAPNPVLLAKRNGERWYVDFVNETFSKSLGYDSQELVGRPWHSLLAPSADRKVAEDCRVAMLSGQRVDAEMVFHRSGGEERLFHFGATPILDRMTDAYDWAICVFTDVTERRSQERLLREEAQRDPLTGLFNRRQFERALSAAIRMTPRAASPHSLLFIDLDHFKSINDTLGHDAGDDVLVSVARIFHSCVFESDEIARWGGDEFAAILFFCNQEHAARRAQRMIDALAHSPQCLGAGASIAVLPITAGSSPAELLRQADRLLYEAKKTGRNRVVTAQSVPT